VGFSRPPIFHSHLTFSTATFELCGREDGHLATLLRNLKFKGIPSTKSTFVNKTAAQGEQCLDLVRLGKRPTHPGWEDSDISFILGHNLGLG
jgi:hypothetical protein